jgi:hypothetical protein
MSKTSPVVIRCKNTARSIQRLCNSLSDKRANLESLGSETTMRTEKIMIEFRGFAGNEKTHPGVRVVYAGDERFEKDTGLVAKSIWVSTGNQYQDIACTLANFME